MGGPLQVADLPIIFLGDKCCACLRLRRGYRKSGDGGAGDGRTEVEWMNQEDIAGAELCVWQALNWQDGWLSHTNLGPALSLGFQHTSSVQTDHVSSKHVETDNSASRCVYKHVTSYTGRLYSHPNSNWFWEIAFISCWKAWRYPGLWSTEQSVTCNSEFLVTFVWYAQ